MAPAPGPGSRPCWASRCRSTVAPMLMVTSALPPFIQPVVILRGRKLSFKQLANGTVVIGGGHRGASGIATATHRARLAPGSRSARARCGSCSRQCAEATIVRAWAGIEAPHARRHPGGRAERDRGRRLPSVRLLGPRLPARAGRRRMMAELVTAGSSNLPIEPFSIGRFAGRPAA